MKNVLILGCGRGQIPIMKLCQSYGWNVIGVSPKGDYPGLEIADVVIYANVRDAEDVLDKIRIGNICIDAVVTDQLDVGVLTAARIADELKLKGIGSNIATLFTNKYAMREKARELGFDVPCSVSADSYEQAVRLINDNNQLFYPLMLKPVDSDASRGVYKITNQEELFDKIPYSLNYSHSGKVILENYIAGKEYVVEAYTSNYKTTNLTVGHRDYFDIPDTFIPCATVFSDADSASSALEVRLKDINKKLVEGFGLPFGITHAEYLYDENADKIYLVEIAARGGGVFISSDLIPAACGVNANDLLVREVLSIDSQQIPALKKGAAAYFCYLTPKGTVVKIDGLEHVKKIKGVRKAFFDNIHIGQTNQSIKDKSSRKGPILVEGKTKADCYRVIKEVKNVLCIEVEDNGEKKGIIWG